MHTFCPQVGISLVFSNIPVFVVVLPVGLCISEKTGLKHLQNKRLRARRLLFNLSPRLSFVDNLV